MDRALGPDGVARRLLPTLIDGGNPETAALLELDLRGPPHTAATINIVANAGRAVTSDRLTF
jgi:hypothetical protein